MTTTEPTPEAVEELARAVHVLEFPSHADCDPKAYQLAEARLYLRAIESAALSIVADVEALPERWDRNASEFRGEGFSAALKWCAEQLREALNPESGS